AGTIRAAQFTGGGVVFPPSPRDFDVKVNKKAARAALRAALSDHVQAGSFALLSASAFDTPSTKSAADLLGKWGGEAPAVVVVNDDEETLGKSFRNLDRVIVTTPQELEVAEVVWARSLLVSESALDVLQRRAS
ncbi:MAG: 50S ribosomal protein L4, partial [Gaiellaceae bacterium]